MFIATSQFSVVYGYFANKMWAKMTTKCKCTVRLNPFVSTLKRDLLRARSLMNTMLADPFQIIIRKSSPSSTSFKISLVNESNAKK